MQTAIQYLCVKMPQSTCVVPECSNTGDHILPKDKYRRDQWIVAIRRGKTKFSKWSPPSKYSYVCRDHFTSSDYVGLTYYGGYAQQKRLKPTAVPGKFAWTKKESAQQVARQERQDARSSKRNLFVDVTNTMPAANQRTTELENILLPETVIPIAGDEIVTSQLQETSDIPCTAEGGKEAPSCNVPTQTDKQPMFSIENLRGNNAQIRFYTGLDDIDHFYFVLNTLGPAAYHLNYIYFGSVSLNVPDQLFLVLIKLRQYRTNQELSWYFGVSERLVSSIFITWINFMSMQWRELNIWPPKEMVQYFAPESFKKSFPTTRVIIDGTECPIKKPTNPKTQQTTFSTYKNRNTVKVLVGITPGGLTSFVSPSYGGSASDRQITERSNLVQLCDPKDSIMADKGFNVQDLFAPRDVAINIPTFFKKKNRMSGDTVLRDRKISSKRVHVERVIGLAKTYKILTTPMSATEAKLSSEIIFICFMLCNLRRGIVPKDA